LKPDNSSESAIGDWCVEYLSRTLDVADQTIAPDVEFARLGLDSANSVYLVVELEEWLGIELTPNVIFEYPTIAKLARYLATRCADGNGGR
jgi:acyl carrier protein